MERTIATSIYGRKRRTSRHKRKVHRWTLLLVAATLALFATALYFVNIWLNPTVL